MEQQETPVVKPKVYRAKGEKGGVQRFLAENRLSLLGALLRGTLGGIVLAFSCLVYLSIDSKYLSTALLPFSFLIIAHYKFKLFHQEVGYALNRNKKQNWQLVPVAIGNTFGLLAVAFVLSYTRLSEKLVSRAGKVMTDRLADTALSVFVLAVLCGLLLFISADGFQNAENGWKRFVMLFLPIMAFVFCGLEFAGFNIFYITVATQWSLKALWYVIIATLGNTVGSLIIPGFYMLYRRFFLKKS